MIFKGLSAIILCLLYSIQLEAQKCDCSSFPLSRDCVVKCLKTASAPQLEQSLKLPKNVAQKVVSIKNRTSFTKVEDFKNALTESEYVELNNSVNNSITDSGNGVHFNGSISGGTVNIYNGDAKSNQANGSQNEPKTVDNLEFTDGAGNLARYSGQVINNVPNGKGTSNGFVIYNGQTIGYTYTGDFVAGRQQGKGTLRYNGGWTVVDCTFIDNFATGKCRVEIPNFIIYDGNMLFGLFDGQGTETWLVGEVENCPKCTKYIGEWKAGLKSGYGRCYNNSGTLIYEGKFSNHAPTEKYPNRNQ